MNFNEYEQKININSEYLENQKRLESAYKMIFSHADMSIIQFIMDDLKDFTRSDKSIFSPDPLTMARFCGRQEVYYYISNLIK